MTLKIAKRVILGMCSMAVGLTVLNTFFDQSYIGALIGLASASAFYFAYRNPEIMMARSWAEFGRLYDSSRDKKYIWGFPAYHALMLFIILYIWLV